MQTRVGWYKLAAPSLNKQVIRLAARVKKQRQRNGCIIGTCVGGAEGDHKTPTLELIYQTSILSQHAVNKLKKAENKDKHSPFIDLGI